jgi:isocitrate dehydrogenase (NAD+)
MRCVIVPGDGIGPEVLRAAQRVLEAAGAEFEWVEAEAGAAASARYGTALPTQTVEQIAEVGLALKGPTATPIGTGAPSANVALRKALDLYANLRPVTNLPGIACRYPGVDLVVVRENTEDLYAGLEHVIVPGVVVSLKVISEKASTRIARFAFDYARAHGRKRVHIGHKANIMKLSDGLFLECCRKVGREFPEIETREIIVDALCMQLVKDPGQFDVLLLQNLYGDIISDLCAGMVGGLGVVAGANLGEHCAVFEAAHGTAPDIAGKGLANPTAILRSSVLMLDYVGKCATARRVEAALGRVYREGKHLTPDVGGKAGTEELTAALIAAL